MTMTTSQLMPTLKNLIAPIEALGLKEISTSRQQKNGTIVFQAPDNDLYAIYKSGYVRRLSEGKEGYNKGNINSQPLNKRAPETPGGLSCILHHLDILKLESSN